MRHNRSEYDAHAALAASRSAAVVRKMETARKARTFRDLLARLPFLFTVATVAFAAIAAAAVSII